jgi:murein DD-endopeptidase MepM/ murein hydrolase activator NlpD
MSHLSSSSFQRKTIALAGLCSTLSLSLGLSLGLKSAWAIEEPSPKVSAPQIETAPDPAPPLQVPDAAVTLDQPSSSGRMVDPIDNFSLGATAKDPVDPLAGPIEAVQVDISSREQKPGFAPVIPQENIAAPAQLNLGEQFGSLNISSTQGISWTPTEQTVVPPLPSYLNQKLLRPFSRIGLQNVKFAYPLAIPSPITSLFGWRIHPISGNAKMHTGTDIAAPEGTPVLAAMAGKVLLADYLGGYGLTIALEHSDGTQQTLYGHLSEIFVKPGELIQQGAVIGRVGSTGNSTGPHLHLEFRQLTDAGWMAIDPGTQLEASMKDLTQALKTNSKPQTIGLKPALPEMGKPSPALKLEVPSLSIPLVAGQ